jgi:hypothetical protein
MSEDAKIAAVSVDVMNELYEATTKFGKFASGHEGIAVIEEEFIELRTEVFTNPSKREITISWEMLSSEEVGRLKLVAHKARMREEAIQLAAMAMRFVMDVCDAPGN